MKNILVIFVIFSTLLFLIASEPTILTYFSEHEVQTQSDYIEIGITVHCEDSKLKNAVKKADTIVEKLQKIVKDYCNAQSKKKSECEDAFEASKHNIKPKYQLVRKVETFIAFIVNHKITIKIRKFQGLGKMTDQLLAAGEGLITIDSFQWKQENEVNPERQAIKTGISDGQEICQKMGLKLLRVVSAEEVEQKEQQNKNESEEEQQKGEQGQQQEEQPAQVIIFKFEVECN